MIILLEDLIFAYQYIKIHSEFEEYFVPDCDRPSYCWSVETYIYLGHSLFVALYNDTCVKSFMETQAYKVVNTHANEISGWKILSIIIHAHAPHLGVTNGDVQSDLSTLSFNNR